jgi:hypothetical protein
MQSHDFGPMSSTFVSRDISLSRCSSRSSYESPTPFTFPTTENSFSSTNHYNGSPNMGSTFLEVRPNNPFSFVFSAGSFSISQLPALSSSYVQPRRRRPSSPFIKVEPNADCLQRTVETVSPPIHVDDASEIRFGTEVDTLMKAIQAKSQSVPLATDPEIGSKKRYKCTVESCTKSFYQKTHLNIHERAHTGAKPYVRLRTIYEYSKLSCLKPCQEPGCGRSFSQLGNLKVNTLLFSIITIT